MVTRHLILTALALAALAGCSGQPEVEVTSGDSNSQAFEKLVAYYDLPPDLRSFEWVETRDWDSNQIYIRVSVESQNARILTGRYGVKLEKLRPYDRGCKRAQPRGSQWESEVPNAALEWGPEPGSASQCGSGHTDTGHGYWSDALVAWAPDQTRAVVYLHLTQT